MPEGGILPNGDLSQEEINRRRELSSAQARAYADQRMADAGIGRSFERAEDSYRSTYEDSDDEPGENTAADPVETLRQNQAAARLTAGLAGTGGAAEEVKEEIQTHIDKANHYLLVEILPNVVSFDLSSFGLLSFLTLPFVYWPVALLWGLEVYNDFTGNTTPLTPRLSWKSFSPPATDIDIPLPTAPLWIAYIAYVFLISILSLFWIAVAFIILYGINTALSPFGGLSKIFSIFSGAIGF